MTVIGPGQDTSPPPWGYAATLGWALLATVASAVAGYAALELWFPGADATTENLLSDARLFTVVSIASVAAEIAALVIVARLAGWRPADYLGMVWPDGREAAFAFAWLAALVVGMDLLTYVIGQDVVTPFQIDIYRSAQQSGALLLLWITLVVAAPLGEELMFRGFLFRGWARTRRDLILAIVLISALWALLHTQYGWYHIVQIFILGLFLGWVRWRSGSTLLTVLMHAAINAWSTIQTVIKLNWL